MVLILSSGMLTTETPFSWANSTIFLSLSNEMLPFTGWSSFFCPSVFGFRYSAWSNLVAVAASDTVANSNAQPPLIIRLRMVPFITPPHFAKVQLGSIQHRYKARARDR